MTEAVRTRIIPRQNRTRAAARLNFYLCLVASDIVSIFTGFFLASIAYHPGSGGGTPWATVATVLAPLYLGIAGNSNAYSIDLLRHPARGLARPGRALILAAGVMILVAFYLKTSQSLSRLTFALGFTFSFGLLILSRDFLQRRARRILGGSPFNVAVICDRDQPIPYADYSSLIRTDEGFDPDHQSPAMYEKLSIALRDVDRVIVSCPPERRASWARALRGANIQSEIVASELQDLAPLGLHHASGVPTLIVATGPLSRSDAIVKRCFDLVVSLGALVFLGPLMIVIAVLIKLDSPGEVFFVQTRIGRGNYKFRMLKFRSMRADLLDHEGSASTARRDARVTRVGAFIRRTSIDELPQLINTLKGDMSIVGPRPHALGSRAEDKLFWEIDERYWHRHAAKPGLTGLAQVRGFRGATLVERDLTDRLQADLEYLNGWTIWRDVIIVLMTVRVLTHRNAF